MIAQLRLEDAQPWTAPEPDEYSHEARVLHTIGLAVDYWQKPECSREALVASTGLSDREVRRAIANLRDAGHIIVDVPGGGYRLGDRQQALACADRLERRARTELARAQKMRTAAGRAA